MSACSDLLDGNVAAQSADDEQVCGAAVGEGRLRSRGGSSHRPLPDFGLHRQRKPQIDGLSGIEAVEARWRDADDSHRHTGEPQRPADRGRIAAQLSLPEPIADDHDGMRPPRQVIARGQQPAEVRLDAKDVEEVAGDQLSKGWLTACVCGDSHALGSRDAAKRAVEEIAPLVHLAAKQGGKPAISARRDRSAREEHETLGLAHGQVRNQDLVHEAEHRGVRAERQAQGADGDGGEYWLPA